MGAMTCLQPPGMSTCYLFYLIEGGLDNLAGCRYDCRIAPSADYSGIKLQWQKRRERPSIGLASHYNALGLRRRLLWPRLEEALNHG